MDKIKFSLDEVLKEVERLSNTTPDGFSILEMSRKVGKHRNWCRRHINDLIIAGKAKYNGRRKVLRMDKSIGYVPVYTLIKEKRGKKTNK